MKTDPRDKLIAGLWRAVVDANGGEDSVAMLREYARGRTLELIAADHGVSKTTAHRRIHRLHSVLSEAGALTAELSVPEIRNEPLETTNSLRESKP